MDPLAGQTVAVTGATGFIGRHLVRELLARGARPVGVVRNPERVPALREAGVELRRADLTEPRALEEAFAGVDAVMANAGVVSLGTERRDALVRANVEGTRNVLEALARAGVTRVVHTSSVSVYRRKRGTYHEDDPLHDPNGWSSPFGHYAVTKAAAEREAVRLASSLGLRLAIARPGAIYGAWDEVSFTRWFLRVTRVPAITAFPTRLAIPVIYAGDLARAMCELLVRDVPSGRAYNLTGEAGVPMGELLEAYRAAGGRVPRLVVPIPVPLRYAYDLTRAKRELGLVQRPLIDGFREAIALGLGA